MNNEELKKKISQIISEYCCPYGKTHKQLYGDDRMCYSKMNFAECNPITECTDALIAAGIGDVSELKKHRVVVEKSLIPEDDNVCVLPNIPPEVKQLYSGEEVEQIVKERDEYKHRAERAERQARKACEVVFSEEIDNEPWDDMLYIYKDECGIDELGITSDMLYNYLKEQAEKELAEEGKND